MTALLDCTVRDGGYINDWEFSNDFVEALYSAASESGCSFVEIGFFNPRPKHSAPWCNVSPAMMARLRAVHPAGAGLAVMIDFGSCKLEEIPAPADYPVDLIRIAAAKKDFKEATEFAANLQVRGHRTTVNYMAITEYSDGELAALVETIRANAAKVAYFYVADSFGSLLPNRAREIFALLGKGCGEAKLGFHPHNNLQLAFSNSLEAMEHGFSIVDGSVYGMGRGAGNLFLEAALAYLERRDPRFTLLPILRFADLFGDALKERYSWGYSLPQLISGALSCHPNYPTNLLAERQYSADEIYHMLQRIDSASKARYSEAKLSELKRNYELHEFQKAPHQPTETLLDGLRGKAGILLLAGGSSVVREQEMIRNLVIRENLYVVSINHPRPLVDAHAVIFGNRRRLLQHYAMIDPSKELLLTQSIHEGAEHQFGLMKRSRLNIAQFFGDRASPFATIVPSNSAIESILALSTCGCSRFFVAGLDGFSADRHDYYNEPFDSRLSEDEAKKRNDAISAELEICAQLGRECGFGFTIVTPTLFERFTASQAQ